MTFRNGWLTDGTQVAIIQDLNSTQYIIQHLAASPEGDFFPTGERLVESKKSVYTEKVKSAKEIALETAEKQLEKVKQKIKDYEDRIKVLDNDISTRVSIMKNSPALGALESAEADLLVDFMYGRVKYLVIDKGKYDTLQKPVNMTDYIGLDGTYDKKDDIRLCTILGKSGGKLTYLINSYADGSGNWTGVYPFASESEAHKKLLDLFHIKLDNGFFHRDDLKLLKELGIEIDKDTQKKIKEHEARKLRDSIESMETGIKEKQENLKELQEALRGVLND